MSRRDVSLWLLSVKMKGVFAYPMLHPTDIVDACCNYVGKGCKTRAEFESIVIYLMRDDQYNKRILLEE